MAALAPSPQAEARPEVRCPTCRSKLFDGKVIKGVSVIRVLSHKDVADKLTAAGPKASARTSRTASSSPRATPTTRRCACSGPNSIAPTARRIKRRPSPIRT